MKNASNIKVGKVVASNYRTARVFTAHGIDFCCGGGISVKEACRKANTDLKVVLKELELAVQESDHQNYRDKEADELIDIIIEVHHHYVKTTVPGLSTYLEKLCRVHGERHPELLEIQSLFEDGKSALEEHMDKEELILFPFIKAMTQANRKGFPLSRPHFGTIENPLSILEDEHENEGKRFQKIAEISGNYEVPDDACQTYRVAYAMLKEFQEDLHRHIHIENNILFPAARELFKEFNFSYN